MMLDLETLSTNTNAALLQAGWCIFDPASQLEGTVAGETHEENVDVDSCMRLGGHVSDSTVRWWLEQSAGAQESVRQPGRGIEFVVNRLVSDFKRNNCKQVWSHGASFDVPIIEFYMKALGVEAPWRFWDIRCTRSTFALAEATGWRRPKAPTAHTAAADAVAQALDVQVAWRHVTSLASRPTTAQNPMDPSFRPGG
jgi:hypothetical protein